MAGNVVQMDYERVEGTAKSYDTQRTVVNGVATAVINTLESIKNALFFAPAIVAKIVQWQQGIREKTKALSDKLEEMAQDLRDAINDHKNGDVEGKKYFMKGVRL